MLGDENKSAEASGGKPDSKEPQLDELLITLNKMKHVMEINTKRGNGASNISMDTFSGHLSEDVRQWLNKFEAWIVFNGWLENVDKTVSAIQLKLEGNALSWFHTIPNITKQSSSTLFKGFLDHFSSLHPTWMLEQQLYERSLSSEQQETIQLLTKSIQEMKATDDGARINSASGRNSNIKCQLCDRFGQEAKACRRYNGVVIDFNAQKISFDPRRVLIAKSDITVPPKSEVVIAAKIKGAQFPENVLGLASESPSLASYWLLAKNSIAHVNNGTAMHGLFNIFDKPIKIKKNSNVGKFVCISRDDKLYDVNLGNTQPVAGDNKGHIDMPDISRDLKVEERGQLNDLLRKYSDVFVNKEGKLGQCGVIDHEIHIPDTCKPIRQRSYKLGAKQKEVLENVVSDMLKDGIVESSTSPCAAPCLLVAKRVVIPQIQIIVS
ncbi:unnamed protein product [Mytilus coruscus]|uniref:Retrotransposon gag domain-containing protein n=1 Tax=Mytilus coruscus TaxID=42192 RepID=A0A6J8EVU8_MYTCO|nr:unnamed protein product [Mytilus coruscus]